MFDKQQFEALLSAAVKRDYTAKGSLTFIPYASSLYKNIAMGVTAHDDFANFNQMMIGSGTLEKPDYCFYGKCSLSMKLDGITEVLNSVSCELALHNYKSAVVMQSGGLLSVQQPIDASGSGILVETSLIKNFQYENIFLTAIAQSGDTDPINQLNALLSVNLEGFLIKLK